VSVKCGLCSLVVRVPGYRTRGPRFESQCYQIFWEVLGLRWGPLSLVSTIEELLERKSNSSGLEIREYGRGDPSSWPRDTLYQQKLALTSPTSGSYIILRYSPRRIKHLESGLGTWTLPLCTSWDWRYNWTTQLRASSWKLNESRTEYENRNSAYTTMEFIVFIF
jgi:hypothetical protein